MRNFNTTPTPYEIADALRLLNHTLSHLYSNPLESTHWREDRNATERACDDLEMCRRLVLADLREAMGE